MPQAHYNLALKAGKKTIQANEAAGLPTSLPSLDDILENESVRAEVPLGLIDIPTELIAGTRTKARASSFAPDFMPVLEDGSEFSMKWKSLCSAHLQEGIRDPVIAYEYLNKYYILEGNKRVSVLKFFNAASVPGYVTRIIPAWQDTEQIRLYYEFLDFYDATNIYFILFSREGSYRKLCSLTDQPFHKRWSFEDRIDLRSCYIRFEEAFRVVNDNRLSCTPGDAMLTYLFLFGYDQLKQETPDQIQSNLKKVWEEIDLNLNEDREDSRVALKMDPTPDHRKNIITNLFTSTSKAAKADSRIAFIHSKTAETSSWTYGHELGRMYIQDIFHGQIETTSYDNNTGSEDALASIEQAISEGNTIIFTTSPQFLSASITAAVNHPEVKILNCSLNASHKYIRTYYARMFEAKLLSGILAGIMTDTNKIGYIADYPIAGMLSNINAFSIGAKMVNPDAKIYLEWSTLKKNQGVDLTAKLSDLGANYISHHDMIVPRRASRRFGLYRVTGEKPVNLAFPIWDWGKYYERIIYSIWHGTWNTEEKSDSNKAVTYWWGMSAGVIDIVCSEAVPQESRMLLSALKNALIHYDLNPFSGVLRSQEGILSQDPENHLTAKEIIYMDWLADNVIGSIPDWRDLIESAQPFVRQEGITRRGPVPAKE